MHEHVAMMVNFVDEAMIGHLNVLDYFHLLLLNFQYSIYCHLMFDLMMIVVVAVVDAIAIYF